MRQVFSICACHLAVMLLELFLGYLALSFAVTLYLGYLQTPAEGPAHEGYTAAALVSLCVQGLATLLVLGGGDWFFLGALWLAFTLLCHHAVIHRNSRFEGEACACAPFQCKDASNHETWVVAALVAATVSGLRI